VNGDWAGETDNPAMDNTNTGSGSALNWLTALTGGATGILGAINGNSNKGTVDQLANANKSQTNIGPWLIGAALIGGGLLIVALIFRGR